MSALIESVALALRSVLRSPMRSALTVLGILIGIAAVVVVVSLGEAARAQVTAQIQSLGSDLIYVFNASGRGRSQATEKAGRRLSAKDADALRQQVPDLRGVTVYASLSASVASRFEDASVDIVGADQDYATVRGYTLLAGRDLSVEEVKTNAKVALVGTTAAQNLFGGVDPVGQWLRIGRHRFEVVGALSSKGFSPFGTDQDDRIVVPIGTWQSRISPSHGDRVDIVIASAPDARSVPWLKERMDEVMMDRHRIPPGGKRDYNLFTQDQFRQGQQEIYQILSLILVSVAGVSLFVGGVGVMNILLVSVTERQKEIGTRLAVGARAGDIRLQFLAEAVVLTLMGGLCGVGLAWIAVRSLARQLQWQMSINAAALAAALGTSLVLGLVFGLLPAQRAARLDPMQALRHE